MFDRLSDWIFAFLNALPNLFVNDDSPHRMLARTALFLLLLALVVYLIAMRPFRATIARWWDKASKLFQRRR